MELVNGSVQKTGYIGHDDFNLAAGKFLKIETSPDGDDLLTSQVPEGKQWRIQINVEITESDA